MLLSLKFYPFKIVQKLLTLMHELNNNSYEV